MSHRVFDKDRMFWDALTMASGFGVGTVNSASIDMGVADADETGDPEVVAYVLGPTSAGGNTGVLQLVVQDSADNSSFATIMTDKASAANAADMGLGSPRRFKLPIKHRRYVRLQAVVSVQAFTAGSLSAGVV